MRWDCNSSSRPRLLARDNYGLGAMKGAHKRHFDNRKTFLSLLFGEGAAI